jgi:hypothetical protein
VKYVLFEIAGRKRKKLTRSDARIRTCADAIPSRYDDVPTRSHVLTIAHRQTRDCLRGEHCDALAVA